MCAASTTPRETSVEAAAKSPRRRPVGRSWVPLVVGLALASQGCVYVTQKVREEKLTNLDQDGDGAPYDGPLGKEDCDDNNPKKSPLLEEIPYDGLDNDCGGDGDLVDIDGDGYPGILFADWKPENGVAWPDNVDQEALDCVDTLDPEADADRIAAGWEPAEIFPSPNNPNEIGYDGIDSDCAADNDFDGDEDGYLLDEVQADFESYVTLWGYEDRVASWFPSGAAAYGDCDDADPLAYPGNPDDALYDGRDANCDGVRNGTEDEFIEIVNISAAAIDLTNYSVRDDSGTIRHVFSGTILAPGQALVLFGGGTPYTSSTTQELCIGGAPAGVIIETASTPSLGLNNDGDTVEIFDSTFTLVSSYTYGAEANADQSLTRDPDLDVGAMVQHEDTDYANDPLTLQVTPFSPGLGNDLSSL